jgi:mycofactocin biosynthetic radical S-adenosylmethionine protein MftC
VYACPFVIHKEFPAGSVRVVCHARRVQGRVHPARVFTGIALHGPDPECVFGHSEEALANAVAEDFPAPGPLHARIARSMKLLEPARIGAR